MSTLQKGLKAALRWLLDFFFPLTRSEERFLRFVKEGGDDVSLYTSTYSLSLFAPGRLTGATPYLYVRGSVTKGERQFYYERGFPFPASETSPVDVWDMSDAEAAGEQCLQRERDATEYLVQFEARLKEACPGLTVTAYKPSVQIAA